MSTPKRMGAKDQGAQKEQDLPHILPDHDVVLHGPPSTLHLRNCHRESEGRAAGRPFPRSYMLNILVGQAS